MEEERGALDVAFRQQEVAAFLVEHPEVYAYVRARLATVKGLLEELHRIAQRAGVTLETTSSIFARPITRAWEEGTGLRETAQAVDSVSIVAYHQTPDEVRADVRWFKLMCPDKPFTLALNAGHPNALSADDLAQKAAVAAQEGARRRGLLQLRPADPPAAGMGGPGRRGLEGPVRRTGGRLRRGPRCTAGAHRRLRHDGHAAARGRLA